VPPDDLFPKLPVAFGRYRILRRLGQGGMGAVYLAEDTKLRNRKTAIKLPTRMLDAASAVRFQREAEAAAVLEHPNICTVYDVGSIDGRQYLAMKYVEGQPLNRLVGRGKQWPPESAVPLVKQLAEALQFAHEQGVIHRDIKPANVMLTAANGPVLMDFGLAKLSGDPTLTKDGAIFGTPSYMSLEQARGDLKAVGPHSDVYSLGVVLFQLLTGDLPFVGDTPVDVFAQIALMDIPPLRERLPDSDPQLESVCAKAMAKSIQERYSSARQFADALTACQLPVPSTIPAYAASLGEFPPSVPTPPDVAPPVAESQSPISTVAEPRVRSRRVAGVAILATLLAGAAIWGLTRKGDSPDSTTGPLTKSDGEPKPTPPGDGGKLEDFTWKGEARQRTVTTLRFGGENVEFVSIPAGTFTMGSPADEPDSSDDEKPQHTVTFTRPLWVAKYPITKGQFAAFVTAMAYKTEAEEDGVGGWGFDEATLKYERNPKYTWRNTGWPQTDPHPVVNVTYKDATAYCDWATKQANRPLRLLSEAEYEYANRSGSAARYPTGDDPLSLEGYANVADRSVKAKLADLTTIDFADGFPFTSPVGQFLPNGFGLFDMTGNVRSWCGDTYDAKLYARGNVTDPTANIQSGEINYVHRGSSWEDYGWNSRAAYRVNLEPNGRCSRVGFRVCFSANP
jgi:formylglycine-generating enzyme required for sulfatase activity/predicted Ser/Thr protein kinase